MRRSTTTHLRTSEPNVIAQDLNELVREVARLLVSAALVHGATLRIELAPSLPHARGDGIQLQQVLLNLIVNALDAVSRRPPDTRLVVVQTRVAVLGYVELSVTDSGEGIAAADIERIFEPLFTTKTQGLGMGLVLSRTIVESYGGRLWAERRPGEGATFRCALPVWDEDARTAH
jgi:signal transduction histidine kinase